MIQRLSLQQCQDIYDRKICAGGLIKPELLEAAVEVPFQAGYGTEMYPTLIEKAARLAYGIAEAQAYVDGNKRLAWFASEIFLGLNGTTLDVAEEEAARAVKALGQRTPTGEPLLPFKGFVSWMTCCSVDGADFYRL